jgi:peptidoglycan/LPS O-acetylase OafA/YrhL
MKYRADIDGLRGIAVLFVILSHAGIPGLTGGAIGVDVFFVISGFLITSIIVQEMGNGNWFLLRFYERRARRILPALLFVIVVITPFCWYLMLPDYLQNYGQSVTSTLLFSNNVLLSLTGGYWQLDSSFKPLLHTWSLGVEEQFYFVFPIFLAIIWRFGRSGQVIAIVVLGLISLCIAEFGWRYFPDENFYLPTGRAWELMVGCLAAYASQKVQIWQKAAGSLGLIAIVMAAVLFSDQIPSPSIWILLPVIGTGLVLVCSSPGSLCWRILTLPPLVWVGIISYSAYLWHQPLFALARVASLDPPATWVMLVLAALSLGLAWISWRFIEQPFRKPATVSRAALVLSIGTVSLLLIVGGIFLHVSKGLPERVFPNIESTGAVDISYNERIRAFSGEGFSSAAHPRILVIGDSFARDIANTLIELEEPRENALAYASDDIGNIVTDRITVSTVNLLQSADLVILATANRDADEIISALNALESITQGRVIMFGTKNFGANINPFIRVPMEQRSAVRSEAMKDFSDLNDVLRGRLPEGQYIDVMSLLGEDGRHVAIFDGSGNPLTPDRAHLTRYGAIFLAQKLAEHRSDFVAMLR